MHQHYRTKAIVLKKEDRGEADQVFTLFSQEFGKIEVVGKAIRKINSKLRAGIDTSYLVEVEFIQGKNQKTLTDAIVIEKNTNSFEVQELFGKILDSVDSLVVKEEQDERVWELLYSALQVFSSSSGGALSLVYYAFLWKFFSLLGYAPELYHCIICNNKLLPETFSFYASEGGIVCWQCIKKIPVEDKQFVKQIAVNVVKILRLILQKDINFLIRVSATVGDLQNLEAITSLYFDYLKEVVA